MEIYILKDFKYLRSVLQSRCFIQRTNFLKDFEITLFSSDFLREKKTFKKTVGITEQMIFSNKQQSFFTERTILLNERFYLTNDYTE